MILVVAVFRTNFMVPDSSAMGCLQKKHGYSGYPGVDLSRGRLAHTHFQALGWPSGLIASTRQSMWAPARARVGWSKPAALRSSLTSAKV